MIDIAKLRALHEAATPGEWEHAQADWQNLVRRAGKGPFLALAYVGANCAVGHNGAADAEWIVEAHNALPALLDELEALRSQVLDRDELLTAAQAEIERLEKQVKEQVELTTAWFQNATKAGWDGSLRNPNDNDAARLRAKLAVAVEALDLVEKSELTIYGEHPVRFSAVARKALAKIRGGAVK